MVTIPVGSALIADVMIKSEDMSIMTRKYRVQLYRVVNN